MLLASPGRSSAVLYCESLTVRVRNVLSCCSKGQEALQGSALVCLKLNVPAEVLGTSVGPVFCKEVSSHPELTRDSVN